MPRLVDVVCGQRGFASLRRATCADLAGEVLEIGFGSGLNLGLFPAAVERVLAVEPSRRARDLAAERIAASPVPVEFVGDDAQRLALADASVDAVVCTWTLCTIPDARRALGEIARVLRPGGALHFVEHGLAPDERVARWQRRLTPLQRRVAGGCRLDRPIADLVTAAGLEVESLRTFYAARPKTFAHFFQGVARRA